MKTTPGIGPSVGSGDDGLRRTAITASPQSPGNVHALASRMSGPAQVLGEIARVLHEELDIAQDDIRPEATFAQLGLGHFHWWGLHEAVLEVMPHLGNHPCFNDLNIIDQPLAALARWRPLPAARGGAPAAATAREIDAFRPNARQVT